MGITRRFFSRWQNWVGLSIVTAFVLTAFFAPIISPINLEGGGAHNQTRQRIPQPPAPGTPLGTLPDQSSVYDALIWGTRDALKFGVGVTVIIFMIGTFVGTLAAFLGGKANALFLGVADTFLAFPVIAGVVFFTQLKNITLANLLLETDFANFPMDGMQGLGILETLTLRLNPFLRIDSTALAFSMFLWVPYARVMNASVMRLKRVEFVLAAKVSGVKNFRVMLRHLIPNAIAPVLVMAATDVGALVVLQTTFAYIGLGTSNRWATALLIGRDWIFSPKGIIEYWWVFLPITVALILFGIGWNLLGDGLIEAMNPRSVEN